MSSLAIRRWSLSFEVPASAGSQAVASLSRTLRNSLPDHLRSRWPQHDGDDGDGRVLLIRRLNVELQHSTAATIDDLADTLADAIACGVQKAQADGAGGVFFPDQAAFNAAYIAARLDGNAHSRWWFRGFGGLVALSHSAMLRTLLQRDPGMAWHTLTACGPTLRARLWPQISADDAGQILRELGLHPPPGGDGLRDEIVWEHIAHHLVVFASEGLPPPAAILATAIELAAIGNQASAGHCVSLAEPLSPILARIGHLQRAQRGAAATQSSGWDAGWAVHARVRSLPPALITALSDALAPQALGSATSALERWHHSPLAGYALLLPLIDSGLPRFVGSWSGVTASSPASGMLRLLMLASCAGDRDLWQDGVWRDALGIVGSVTAADIARWVETVGPAQWSRFQTLHEEAEAVSPSALPPDVVPLEEARWALEAWSSGIMGWFAAALPRFAEASPAFLRANLLSAGGMASILPHCVHFRLARPPLDVLLGMTGAADRTYALSDGRELILERQK